MQKLDPKAVWLFFIGNFILIAIILLFTVDPIWLLIVIPTKITIVTKIIILLFLPFFIVHAVVAVLSYWLAKLQYDNFGFEIKEDTIMIERGIIWKKKSSIPFVKIQNVDIIRGPLARILGLSDLHIQTAGYSGYGGRSGGFEVEGRLPGLSIANAEKLREFLIKKAKGNKV